MSIYWAMAAVWIGVSILHLGLFYFLRGKKSSDELDDLLSENALLRTRLIQANREIIALRKYRAP